MKNRYSCPKCGKELSEADLIRGICSYCHKLFEHPKEKIVVHFPRSDRVNQPPRKEYKEKQRETFEKSPVRTRNITVVCPYCSQQNQIPYNSKTNEKFVCLSCNREWIYLGANPGARIRCPNCGYQGNAIVHTFWEAGCGALIFALFIPIIGWIYLVLALMQPPLECPKCHYRYVERLR